MTPEALYRRHGAALEADEVRHNLLLGLLKRERKQRTDGLWLQSLERPGACALRQPTYGIVLGAVTRDEAARLAEAAHDLDFPSAVGPDDTALDYVRRAETLGQRFGTANAMQIMRLTESPRPQAAPGALRAPDDESGPERLADWIQAFHEEAVPHDPLPDRASLLAVADSGRHFFWWDGETPVAFGAINRELDRAACLGPIYTPPEHRGKGYAGALTAALAERIFATGRQAVCLFQEVSNEAARRCYARVGFEPHCLAWHVLRVRTADG